MRHQPQPLDMIVLIRALFVLSAAWQLSVCTRGSHWAHNTARTINKLYADILLCCPKTRRNTTIWPGHVPAELSSSGSDLSQHQSIMCKACNA
jgi:hypothetical protein